MRQHRVTEEDSWHDLNPVDCSQSGEGCIADDGSEWKDEFYRDVPDAPPQAKDERGPANTDVGWTHLCSSCGGYGGHDDGCHGCKCRICTPAAQPDRAETATTEELEAMLKDFAEAWGLEYEPPGAETGPIPDLRHRVATLKRREVDSE